MMMSRTYVPCAFCFLAVSLSSPGLLETSKGSQDSVMLLVRVTNIPSGGPPSTDAISYLDRHPSFMQLEHISTYCRYILTEAFHEGHGRTIEEISVESE